MGVIDKVDKVLGLRGVSTQLTQLSKRVTELEAEVQECRAINLRLAELCDVVVELLVPLSDRDTDGVAEVIERYRSDLESMGR